MKLRRVAFAGAVALLLLSARPASAALTSSEKAQVKDYVARGRVENAARVRSMVARTDLSSEESIAAVTDALVPVTFDAARANFLREMLFGPASAGARPLLVQAITRGLLARADAVYQRYVGGLDHEPRAITELWGIYAFLDITIANAGKPTASAHDPNVGIPPATYEECAKVLRDHVDQNARWLKGDGPIPESAMRLRAQAHVTLLDMLPDGLTRRVDAADRLGLGAARRRILNDWGILLEDGGKLDELRAERVRQELARLPAARAGVEVIFAGDDRGLMRARGLVVRVGSSGSDAQPFGDEVSPGPHDAGTAGIAQDLASLAAKRGLDARAELRRAAERDAAAAGVDPHKLLGHPRAPSVDHVIGAAVQLLVADPERAIDLAFARYLAGRPESAALLSDAIGALASGDKSLDLGKPMTAIQLASDGSAVGFTFDGHAWTIERAPGVTGVKRDGQPVGFAMLPNAHVPLTSASEWSGGGMSFAKLRGAPHAGVLATDHGVDVKLMGSDAAGLDGIATKPPGADFVLTCDLDVHGTEGGLVIRGTAGKDTVRGAMLLVIPGSRVVLATTDDAGKVTPLAAPIEPDPKGPLHVKITVKGKSVVAVVGGRTLQGTLPAALKDGAVGLVARRATLVRAAQFSLTK
jgi:hypothetical protein